jgi:hypothetical protein
MARRLSELTTQLANNERLRDFLTVCGAVMVSRNGDLTEALGKAVSVDASERVLRVLKAAIAGASTANAGPDFSVLYDAFLDGIRNVGAFDRIAQFALRMPLRPAGFFSTRPQSVVARLTRQRQSQCARCSYRRKT